MQPSPPERLGDLNAPRTSLPVLAAAMPLLTGCGESYDDKADACMAAIKPRPEGDVTRPAACEEISERDYDTLNVADAISGLKY